MSGGQTSETLRIAIVHWTGREVGGAERYLSTVLPLLSARGHEISLLAETDAPGDHEPIVVPPGSPRWIAADLGVEGSVRKLREWRPDVVFTHIVHDPALEAAVLAAAPGVFFAHAYYGTCISGEKTHKSPYVTPCSRRFGPACLFHYYPRRCGGLSPLTMLRDYGAQRERSALIGRYRAVVTNSEHMRREYLRQESAASIVITVPMPVSGAEAAASNVPDAPAEQRSRWTFLFLGRMDRLKGGRVLLDAVTRVQARTGLEVKLVLAGDGPDRNEWEARAARLAEGRGGLSFDFVGRVPSAEVQRLYERADLLVVPSLWPEPFGLVGPEAGLHGVPAAAFAVGGIPDWLTDGVNGHLAPGDRPTADGLAEAIVRCIEDPNHHSSLRQAAHAQALRFSAEAHVQRLVDVLVAAARGERNTVCFANS